MLSDYLEQLLAIPDTEEANKLRFALELGIDVVAIAPILCRAESHIKKRLKKVKDSRSPYNKKAWVKQNRKIWKERKKALLATLEAQEKAIHEITSIFVAASMFEQGNRSLIRAKAEAERKKNEERLQRFKSQLQIDS